ncbi:MAG: hypothetical protein Q7V04_01745 [Deltaproteobacteria bacterium]|nr:hypothetical protein [Deltaproteobacteria bacterium]
MKNIALFLSLLALSAVVSALPAFSSSGPYGTYGPADYTDKAHEGKAYNTALRNGTGPYGAFAIIEAVPGEVSKHAATPGGSGPFGAIASYGMIPDSGSATVGKKDCIMFAKNCIPNEK